MQNTFAPQRPARRSYRRLSNNIVTAHPSSIGDSVPADGDGGVSGVDTDPGRLPQRWHMSYKGQRAARLAYGAGTSSTSTTNVE